MNYIWWLSKKKRIRKKYTLFLGKYMSPKQVKEWYKNFEKMKREKERKK